MLVYRDEQISIDRQSGDYMRCNWKGEVQYFWVEWVEVVKRSPNCQCMCRKTQIEQINMAELSLCGFVVYYIPSKSPVTIVTIFRQNLQHAMAEIPYVYNSRNNAHLQNENRFLKIYWWYETNTHLLSKLDWAVTLH